VKEERRAVLEEIAAGAAHERNRARIGQVLEVLVEGPAPDYSGTLTSRRNSRSTSGRAKRRSCPLQARWRGQAPEVDGRVLIEDADGAAAGERIRVRITDAAPTELTARRVEDGS
jgi:ribosomal protein S12 methylthiotransferase